MTGLSTKPSNTAISWSTEDLLYFRVTFLGDEFLSAYILLSLWSVPALWFLLSARAVIYARYFLAWVSSASSSVMLSKFFVDCACNPFPDWVSLTGLRKWLGLGNFFECSLIVWGDSCRDCSLLLEGMNILLGFMLGAYQFYSLS